MTFNLDEYVDVAERIRMFAEKFPEGSLQGDGYFVRDPDEKIIGYHYVARAYRQAADERPGVGTAYEPIPGKTQFTRDSEVQNAETAAWGRAIVALGFETRKIASRQEVQNRQGSGGGSGVTVETGTPQAAATQPPTSSGTFTPPADVQADLERKQARSVPSDGGVPELVTMPFGKHSGKTLGDLLESDNGYVRWVAEKMEAKNPDQRRVKGAAQTLLGQPVAVGGPVDDSDIPF